MRIILALIFLSSGIIALAQEQDFSITGLIDKGIAYKVHLRYSKDTETALGVDVNETSDIINGKFFFHGSITRPVQAYLVLDGLSSHASFYLDTGNITITASVDRENKLMESVNKIEITDVQGSVSDSLQRDYISKRNKIFESNLDDSVIVKNLALLIEQFVSNYPDHNLSSQILQESFQLTYKQAKSIYDNLSPWQQQNATRNHITEALERAKQLDKLYPFISLPDTAGNLVNGKSPNMKYLLLNFVASYCDDCGRHNADLLKLYKQYSKKGFEILGVSIEFEFTKPEWIHNLNRLKLPWPQVNDLNGNEISSYFKVPHVPFVILVDNTGKILSVNPGKERLKKQIEKLMNF
ncbi:MAG TPA: TlpA disulfide reductase family protein [Cyclobacteriaceae bacterium]